MERVIRFVNCSRFDCHDCRRVFILLFLVSSLLLFLLSSAAFDQSGAHIDVVFETLTTALPSVARTTAEE